jgi:hypothetical protein
MLVQFDVYQYEEGKQKLVHINPVYVVAVSQGTQEDVVVIDVAHRYSDGELAIDETWYVKGDIETVSKTLNEAENSTL